MVYRSTADAELIQRAQEKLKNGDPEGAQTALWGIIHRKSCPEFSKLQQAVSAQTSDKPTTGPRTEASGQKSWPPALKTEVATKEKQNTIEMALAEELLEHCLFENEAADIIAAYKEKYGEASKSMDHRWNDPVDSYPPALFRVLLIGVKKEAVRWIDEKAPGHLARELLTGSLLEQVKERVKGERVKAGEPQRPANPLSTREIENSGPSRRK